MISVYILKWVTTNLIELKFFTYPSLDDTCIGLCASGHKLFSWGGGVEWGWVLIEDFVMCGGFTANNHELAKDAMVQAKSVGDVLAVHVRLHVLPRVSTKLDQERIHF